VLVHGYALDHSFWRYQVHDLADLGRVVCFDQRAHGRSGRSAVVRCTIDQLGEDLALVLDEVAPTGPVVLIGHSMGGMTIMALAERHPEWFGSRIVGVGLLQTSAGKMAEVTFGVPRLAGPLLTRLRPELLVGLSRAVPGRVWPGTGRNGSEPARIGGRVGHELAQALVQRFSFGSSAGIELVAAAEEMLAGTSLETLAAFAPTFLRHDKLRALGVLHDIPVLVVAADADLHDARGPLRGHCRGTPARNAAAGPRRRPPCSDGASGSRDPSSVRAGPARALGADYLIVAAPRRSRAAAVER